MACLSDYAFDVVITDPPYDDHTHRAGRRGCTGYVEPTRPGATKAQFNRMRELGFEPMTIELMQAAAFQFARHAKRWVLVFCSLEMIGDWKCSLEHAGFQYVRAMIWRKRGCTPQFTGDRPAQACEAIVVAHRPGRKKWNGRGRHGFFDHPIVLNRGKKRERYHTAQKPLALMEDLVQLFSNPGELIADPFMGSGTTGVAAKKLGRRFWGCDIRQTDVDVAFTRIAEVQL
jgi:site-specific DNA-methyltransferase (adenine-specific)